MQVYTHDEYGNADVCYTLGDWSASGTITMGDSDIVIVAAWTGESITIPEWKIYLLLGWQDPGWRHPADR